MQKHCAYARERTSEPFSAHARGVATLTIFIHSTLTLTSMAAHALHVPAVPLYNETDGANGDEEVENVQLCLPRCSRGTIKRHCCTWNVYWGAVIWCSLVVTYLLVGGGLFYAAERPHEEDEIDRARREREVALDYLTEVFVNLSNGPNLNLSEQAAGALVDELAEFFDQLDEIPAESSPSWEYGTSVFFAITVITTIGQHLDSYIALSLPSFGRG